MPVELRKANINDIAVLAEMNQQLIADERSRNPLNVSQIESLMHSWLDGSWSAVMISKNENLIGYLLYQQRRDDYDPEQLIIFVRQFFVQRTYRRRGIGREAFEQIVSEYFPSDATIMLDVLATNSAALHFWEDIGFTLHSTTLKRKAITGVEV